MKSRSAIALLIWLVTTCVSARATARPYKAGDDVLVKQKGVLVRAWVVAPATGDRSVVAFTWDTRTLKVVPNRELTPNLRAKLPAHRKLIKGWTAFDPALYRMDAALVGDWMAAAPLRGPIQIFRQDILLPVTQIARTAPVHGLAVSPDGRTLAVCNHRGALTLYGLPAGTLLRTTRLRRTCRHLTFGASGLVALDTGLTKMALRLYDTATGRLSAPQLPIARNQRRSALRFSADGKWLLETRTTAKGARGKHGIRVYAIQGMKLVPKRILPAPGDLVSLAISRDGRFVAATGARTLMVWAFDTGRLLWSKPLAVRDSRVALSHDGSTVAVCGAGRSVVQLIDQRTRRAHAEPINRSNGCVAIRFASSGRFVYVSASVLSNFGEIAVHRVAAPSTGGNR